MLRYLGRTLSVWVQRVKLSLSLRRPTRALALERILQGANAVSLLSPYTLTATILSVCLAFLLFALWSQGSVMALARGAASQDVAPRVNGGEVALSIVDVAVSEGAGDAILTISLDQATTTTTTVEYFTSDGTAIAGLDYSTTTNTASINASSTTTTIAVPIIEDSIDELNETFTVELRNPSGGAQISVANGAATVTIQDNDPAPIVSIADISVDEGVGNATLTITQDRPSSRDVTVDVNTSDVSAAAGQDYTATDTTSTILAGATTTTVAIPVLDDSIDEPNETFTVTISGPTSDAQIGDGAATVTIQDNDPGPVLSVPALVSVGESDGSVTVPITLSAVSGRDVTVNVATSGVQATAGQDYTSLNTTASIPAGQTSTSVVIDILSDSLNEESETFTVTLSDPTGGAETSPTSSSSTVTILDDDPEPTVSIAGAIVNEGVGDATLTISLSTPSGRDVSVDYGTSDGTAIAGQDYTATNKTAIINAGLTTADATIPSIDDPVYEGLDESFTVTLSNPTGAQISVQLGSAVVTIQDNELVPVLSIADLTVDEGVGDAAVIIQQDRPSSRNVTVDYATSDDSATAGPDYTATGGSATIVPGATSTSVAVPIIDDSLDELTEAFTVTLSNPTGDAQIGDGTATVTIQDNDPPPVLSVADLSVGESDGIATLTVSLNAASGRDVTVLASTANGTATAGQDYTATSTRLTILAGGISASFNVTILEDALNEANETFTVALSDAVGGAQIGDGSATVTIQDNDPQPTLSISGVTVDESVGNAQLTIVLDAPSGRKVKVDYATSNGTAFAGQDYSATDKVASIPAGATSTSASVPIIDDTLDELDETFTVELSDATGGAQISAANGSATVTIQDNDASPTLSIDDLVVGEAAVNAILTVSLSAASGRDVSVGYFTADGSAIAGEDYTATDSTANITSGATTAAVIIPILDDEIDELTETFIVSLKNATGGAVISEAGRNATVTIQDNDPSPVLSITDISVDEGIGNATLTITQDRASSRDVTVDFATSDGSAIAGADYAATGDQATVTAGALSAPVTVAIFDDAVNEADETFTVTLSNPTSGAQISVQNRTATITIEDNDLPPTLAIEAAVSITEGSSGETSAISIVVSKSSETSFDITVRYDTADGTAGTAEGDYVAVVAGSLTIPASNATGAVAVTVKGDDRFEADETVLVTLSNASTQQGSITITQPTAILTILDDDLIIVNSTADTSDADTDDGICDVDLVAPGPQCTLRAAIEQANAFPGTASVNFNLSGEGPHAIRPQSALPEILQPIIIDAATQPGFDDMPIVELDGSDAGDGVDGLVFSGGSSTVKGLTIRNYRGNGIVLKTKGGSTIEGNVVSDNAGTGILVSGAGAANNVIRGNSIGSDASGTQRLSNGGDGIRIENSPGNTIGGATEAERNIVSSNLGSGIVITGTGARGNTVKGNYIGTDATGAADRGNRGHGIIIAGFATSTLIGATSTPPAGACTGGCNTIAFNDGHGVFVVSGASNTIRSNSIFSNDGHGIELDDGNNANTLETPPSISTARKDAETGLVVVRFHVKSNPAAEGANYPLVVEFFGADQGGEEGKTLLGSVTYTATDFSSGSNVFQSFVPNAGDIESVVGTATDSAGNTSEFSESKGANVPSTFIVNSVGDAGDQDLSDEVCNTGGTIFGAEMECTLRAAIEQANFTTAGLDTIEFDIAPGGQQSITSTSPLPVITDPVVIDGTSQPGFAGTPLIELNGSGAGENASGLIVSAGGATIRGLNHKSLWRRWNRTEVEGRQRDRGQLHRGVHNIGSRPWQRQQRHPHQPIAFQHHRRRESQRHFGQWTQRHHHRWRRVRR